MTYKYKAQLNTIMGLVTIEANTNSGGYITAQFSTEFDHWKQNFQNPIEFKKYVYKFQITEQISVTEATIQQLLFFE